MSGIIHGLAASMNSAKYLIISANTNNYNIAAAISSLFGKDSKVITNVALTSNVATITTTAAHGFVTGEVVTINCSNAVFEGSYTITGTPTTTTFTYAKTNANIASADANGSVYIKVTVPVNVNVTVNSGVVVGQSYTLTGTTTSQIQTKDSVAAIVSGTLPTGSSVTITNNGYIVGCGGQGGSADTPNATGRGLRWAGGDAINTTIPITIYNNGTIAGGGGGGAGGDGNGDNSIGGGGGAGYTGGIGGFGWGSGPDRYGATGTLTTGGVGTHGSSNGGNLGMPGTYGGQDGTGLVGSAGAYVVGNSNVTWATAGTRLGAAL